MLQAAPLGSVVIGPHCPLTTWVFDAVRRLAAGGHSRTVRQIDRFDNLLFDGEPFPIYLTHYPSPAVIDAIANGDLDVIAIAEDPTEVLAYQQAVLGLSEIDSIRAQTASATANLVTGRSGNAAIIAADTDRTAGSVVSMLVNRLRLDVRGTKAIAEMHALSSGEPQNVSAAAKSFVSTGPNQEHPSPSAEQAALARCVLDPLIAMQFSETIRPICWPTAVFKFAGQPDIPPPAVADVTGPARHLFYGPYLHLPPAYYRVEILLGFSNEIQDIPFLVEIHGEGMQETLRTRARIQRRNAGGYRGFFRFHHVHSSETLEIRLINAAQVNQGKLALIEILFFVEDGPVE